MFQTLHPLPLGDLIAAVRLPAAAAGVVRVDGSPQREIAGIAALAPGAAGRLSFCDLTDARSRVADSASSVVVVARNSDARPRPDQTLVVCDDPRLWFICACDVLLPGAARPQEPSPGIDASATVHPQAWVSPAAAIGARVSIGTGTRVGPGAVVCSGSVIGEHCVIGPGAVIGWVGLAYHRDASGRRWFFPHLGSVRIGDWVDVGANACICRGMLSDTVIGDDVRIGSLVYVSHGVTIGDGAWVSASAAVAGHSQLGTDALIGIGAVIVDNVRLPPGALLGAGSVATRDARSGDKLFGIPARHVPSVRRFGPTPR